VSAALSYVVQHGEKERAPGDPELTALGRRQAALTGRWLAGIGLRGPVLSSPLRRARETAAAIAAETGLAVREDARLTVDVLRTLIGTTTPCQPNSCTTASRPAR
jgi:broad specificity phosphatase PhoE